VKTLYVPIILLILSIPTASALASCDQIVADASAGVVRDTSTGLTWSRCVLGQTGNNCETSISTYSWVDALNKARASELGGLKNWRLPKIEELKKAHGCLAKKLPRIGPSIVWSASANLDYATDAWTFDFGTGEAVVHARDSKLHVLLVASPQ